MEVGAPGADGSRGASPHPRVGVGFPRAPLLSRRVRVEAGAQQAGVCGFPCSPWAKVGTGIGLAGLETDRTSQLLCVLAFASRGGGRARRQPYLRATRRAWSLPWPSARGGHPLHPPGDQHQPGSLDLRSRPVFLCHALLYLFLQQLRKDLRKNG